MTDTTEKKEAKREEYLWVDAVFLVLFLADWAFLILLIVSIPEPVTGEYGFTGSLTWGPITIFALVPVLLLYTFYQGWLLYRKIGNGAHPYRERLRWITFTAFLLTLPFNIVVARIMSGAFQSGG
jgi:hypothetical protein